MKKEDAIKNFLVNRDETGRFKVYSIKSKKTYYVEPISDKRSDWGDIDPVTKKLTGSYGNKYKGAVKESESLITEENGFTNITYSGTDFMFEIERRDNEYLNSL